MNVHMKSIILATIISALLLTGCATVNSQAPTAALEIPDESVPLASAAELPAVEGPVTKRQAEALAIAHAGLTQNDVSFLFTKEDVEDGIDVFEVSFRSGAYSYEFEIAVETGEILSFGKENIRKD